MCTSGFLQDCETENVGQVEHPCKDNYTLKCRWYAPKITIKFKNEMLIPVGQRNHAFLVSFVTILVTLYCSYILIRLPVLVL